jgi:hypothetical protein
MARSATQDGYEHPLIGQLMGINEDAGAKPAGWPEDQNFTDYPTRAMSPVTDVSGSEDGYSFGTIEVAGWYWDPKDLWM